MPLLVRFARPGEWVFAACVLVWLGGATGPYRKLLMDRDFVTALLVLSLLLLARHGRELRGLVTASWPLLLPAFVTALSPAWSLDPRLSLRAAVALGAYTAFGLWLALRFDAAEQHRLVAGVLALIIAVSALLALAAPELAVMRTVHPGAWRGLLSHKNNFARLLALGVLACGLFACARPAARVWSGGAAALALAMLVPARSVGGAAALALAAAPVGLVAGLRRLAPPARVRAALLVGVALALLAALALAAAPTLLALVGRDLTLTRRTEIWALLVAPIREHPWLGHGPAAFWGVAAPSRELARSLQFDPGSGHNGFLDLALELGLVGLVVFGVPYALALVRAVRLALAEAGAGALWPLALLAWLVTSNLPESALMRRGALGWALFIATAATLAMREAARSRRTTG
jgi:exopolysaccharide production protein ExoQ